MSEFSRETLLNIIETDHVQCGDASALARMALAAMDSEPVAENIRIANALEGLLWPNMALGNKAVIQEAIESLRTYHAQPAPVVPAVSDDIGEIRVGRLPTMNQDDYPGLGDWWVQLRIGEDSDEVLARVYGATPQEANNRAEALACRAAMLQELKKSAGTEATCRSNENAQVLTSINPAPALVSLPKNAKSLTGNSPAIPDGYVMVPVEPNGDMLAAAQDAYGETDGDIASTLRAAMLKGRNGRKKIRVIVLGASIGAGFDATASGNSPAQSDCCPAQNHVSPKQNSVAPAQSQGWIPVSERMPEDEQEVLTINRMGHRFVSFFDKHSGLFFDRLDAPAACCIEHVLVTHWMPLPAAPQEVNRE